MPLLGQFQPEHRQFLTEVLRQADQEKISKALADSAGRIIVKALPSLSRSERDEPWVATTIRALVRLPVPSRRWVLSDIVRSRKFVLFREWPQAAREAARETQAELDDRNQAEPESS